MSLSTETNRLRGHWEANEARIEELQAEIDELQTRLLAAEAENMKLRSLSGSYLLETNSFGELNSQHAIDVTRKAVEQQKTLSATQLENARLKKSIALTEAENAKLTIEIHTLRSKLQDMDSVSESNTSLTGSVDDLTSKLMKKTAKLESANEMINTLKYELQRAQLEAEKAKLMIGEHKRIEDENRRIADKIEKHKEELRQARLEIKRLTEKNEKSDEAIAKFEKSLRERERENQKLVEECKSRENSCSQQEDELSDLKDERNSLIKRAEIAEKALKELELEKKKIEDETRAAVKMLEEYKSKESSFIRQEEEISNLKEENIALKQRAEMAENENKRIDGHNKEMTKILNEKENSRSEIEDEIRRIQEDNERLRQRLQKRPEGKAEVHFLRERCAELEAENDEMRGQLEVLESKSSEGSSRLIEIEDMPKTTRQYLMMLERHMELKLSMWGSKFNAQLNMMDIQVSRLKTAWREMCLLSKRKYPIRDPMPDTYDFISHVERGVRLIDAASHTYAESHGYPARKVPPPDVLLSQPGALVKFVDRVETC